MLDPELVLLCIYMYYYKLCLNSSLFEHSDSGDICIYTPPGVWIYFSIDIIDSSCVDAWPYFPWSIHSLITLFFKFFFTGWSICRLIRIHELEVLVWGFRIIGLDCLEYGIWPFGGEWSESDWEEAKFRRLDFDDRYNWEEYIEENHTIFGIRLSTDALVAINVVPSPYLQPTLQVWSRAYVHCRSISHLMNWSPWTLHYFITAGPPNPNLNPDHITPIISQYCITK